MFLQTNKESIFLMGGGGLWHGGSEHNVQMFKMALLLFKEYKCAKLFWNACVNAEEMAQTSSIYNQFITWSSSVSLIFNLPKQVF